MSSFRNLHWSTMFYFWNHISYETLNWNVISIFPNITLILHIYLFSDPTAKTSTGSSVEVYNTKNRRKSDDEIIGMVIGILATLILLLFICMVIIIIRQRRGKLLKSRAKVLKTVEPQSNGTMNLNEIRDSSANGKLSNGKVYSCVASSDIESDREGTWSRFGNYREPMDSIQHRRLPELPRTPESTGEGYRGLIQYKDIILPV